MQEFAYPLDYTLTAEGMIAHTSGGDVPISMGAWGAHTGPHTGHPEGKAASDWDGLYVDGWDDPRLVRFSEDGMAHPGDCRPTDPVCGVHIDDVVNRIPDFIAPVDSFEITRIELVDSPLTYQEGSIDGANPYDVYNWVIDGRSCGFSYGLGHIGSVGEGLRQAMLDRGLPDPATQIEPGAIFNSHEEPIVLLRGDVIGKPQVRWEDLEGHMGYVRGNGRVQSIPAAQIEFDIIRNDIEYTTSEPGWNFLPPETRDTLERALFADAKNPDSFRYNQDWIQDWLWRAELVLDASAPFAIEESGSIHSRMGGWYEQLDAVPCEVWDDDGCDESFSIFPIHTESELYDSSLYDSAEVRFLTQFTVKGFTDWGEVLASEVSPIAGDFVVKWRPRESEEFYQSLSYRVVDDLLLMNYGERSTTRETVTPPQAPAMAADCSTVDKCFVLNGFYVQQDALRGN